MARDRKRAKQRQQRRQSGQSQRKARSDRARGRQRRAPETEADAEDPEAQAAAAPERAPDEELDAPAGADARTDADPDAERAPDADPDAAERAPDDDPDADHEFDDAELDADPDDLTRHDELAHSSSGVDEVELAMATGVTPPGRGGDEPVALEKPAKRERARREAPREKPSGIGRFPAFLRSSWRELTRVQWPDRRQTAQATAVTLGFVVVAGTYLGVLDFIWQEVVSLIL